MKMGVTSFHLGMSAVVLLLSIVGMCSAQLFGGKSEALLPRACPVEKAKPLFNLDEVSFEKFQKNYIQLGSE